MSDKREKVVHALEQHYPVEISTPHNGPRLSNKRTPE